MKASNRTCSIPGCDAPYRARDLCRKHYKSLWDRGQLGPPISRAERQVIRRTLADFPAPTQLETPCRLWQGTQRRKGYGRKTVPGRGVVSMHRWVMEQIHGREAIADLYVLHRCDQPLCYRFDHLFLGTAADNTHDMEAKNRQRGRFVATDDHPGRKLSVAEHEAIRARYTGALGEQAAMAREYGVHPTAILRIVGRRGIRRTSS